MANKNKVFINSINLGGISESKYQGRANSVAKSVGIDLHTIPGIIQANWKLKKDSGVLVDALVKAIVVSTDGNTYFFSSTSGKVWRRTSAGTWSLVYTTVPASGDTGTLGAMEYGDYIYWASENYIHRIAVADTADWTTNAVPNWQLLPITDDLYHPMVIIDSTLWLGDGYQVHQIDDGTYTANALDIISSQRIRCLGVLDYQLLVGTVVDDNINKSTLYRWNRWSDSWNMEDEIQEVGLNALIPMDNYVMPQCGFNSNVYNYDGNVLTLATQVPGTYTNVNYTTVNPNAVAYFNGKPLFGLSRGASATGDPVEEGVYSYATRNPTLYPRILNLEYVISQDKTVNVEIGAIKQLGNLIFVSWKEDTNYGVDILDVANRYSGAYIESRVIFADRSVPEVYSKISVGYVELPASTDIKIYTKQNYADSWTEQTTITDTIRQLVYTESQVDCFAYEVKIELTCSGTSTPIIDDIQIQISETQS